MVCFVWWAEKEWAKGRPGLVDQIKRVGWVVIFGGLDFWVFIFYSDLVKCRYFKD